MGFYVRSSLLALCICSLTQTHKVVYLSCSLIARHLLFQNFDYLTKHETKPEKLELDETTKQKLEQMLTEPDIEADIAWIEVS